MEKVLESSIRLNLQIKESKEYKQYIAAKEQVYQNEALFHALNEFRRKNYELQTMREGNVYDEVNNLVKEYDFVLHNPYVSDFLVAEQKMCRLMREIYVSIADTLEFDYDFING